jgi:hypothetical protein
MAANSHRLMISVWPQFFNASCAQTGLSASLCIQRDVATSALAVDADQNFLVRLQFLADRKQNLSRF